MQCVSQQQASAYGDDGLLPGFWGSPQEESDDQQSVSHAADAHAENGAGTGEEQYTEGGLVEGSARVPCAVANQQRVHSVDGGVWYTHGGHLLGVVEAPTPGPFSGMCSKGTPSPTLGQNTCGNNMQNQFPFYPGKFAWYQGGFALSTWQTMMRCFHVPLLVVRPNTWKGALGLRKLGKEGSRALALELFPQAADQLRCVAVCV